MVLDPEEPLSKEALDEFSNQVLSVCLEYIEKLPETVYKVSDLLTIIVRRNGESFCYKLLNTLAEVVSYIGFILPYISVTPLQLFFPAILEEF